jgi:hypothetical protein
MPSAFGRTAELLLPRSSIKNFNSARLLFPDRPFQDHRFDQFNEACSEFRTESCAVQWNIVEVRVPSTWLYIQSYF